MSKDLKKIFVILMLACFHNVYAQYFDMESISFANESIQIDEEIVEFSYETVSSVLTLRNTSSEKFLLPATITCKPEGYGGGSYSHILIPDDFHIIDNKNEIDFSIENEGKKFTRYDSIKQQTNKESRINFVLSFDAMETKRLHIKYKNKTYQFVAICDTQHYRIATRYLFNQNCFKKTVLYTPNDTILSSYEGSFLMDFLFKREDEYFIVDDFVRIYMNENYQWRLAVPSDVNEVVCRQEYFYPLGDFSPYALWYKHSYPETKGDVYLGFREKDLSKELLSKADLFTLSRRQLSILRNSFYAKYGYGFKNKEIKAYFEANCKDQGVEYKVNPNFSESDFNEIERKNIALIREMENIKKPVLLKDFLK
ncbi:MAG: YARHG domain-containing protein [Treponema sp.]|nr:YARHG domain-containing protein [Treponema sp.]